VEKDFNSPEKIMARALLMADQKVHKLEAQIEADKPKVLFADAVSASHTSILVGELAKLISQNGYKIGANRLFSWMRENGYLIKRKGSDWNMPTQRSMDLKLFEIKETNVQHADGHITVNKTPKVTG
ncbi:TPA: phage antirepressor KilAC domain-containing protein, partial [Streptococcus pneumoniae]